MEKKYIFLVLLLLTVGFASVNTIIDIKGKVNMSLLESDLDVIFKEVLLNKENNDKAFIIDNGKSFIYSADELINVKDTSNIDYTIMNKSHQYDMEVKVTCTSDYDNYLNYTSETINKSILIEAGEVISGNIITELIKENTSNESIVLKCTLNYIPVSRDTVVEEKEYIVSFDTGYEEKVSDIKVKYYEAYGSLPTLERKNYKFLGWYTDGDIKIENNSLVKIKENHTLHAKWEKICEYDIGKTWEFNYTGSEQTFTTPCDGEYKIELWGASGGQSLSEKATYAGRGSYTSGKISINAKMSMYVYIGQQGTLENYVGVFNGGGPKGYEDADASGGGATDVRLINGTWNNSASLKSRIIVSAGGGGSDDMIAGAIRDTYYNSGGGLESIAIGRGSVVLNGATQTSAGYDSKISTTYSGLFGSGNTVYYSAGAGGGGGYYGGGATDYGSIGGSSFISGHIGCNAIDEHGQHTGQPNHYSGYVFKDTVMIDGDGYKWTNVKESYTGMPTHDGKSTMTGNSGNGYAKITYLG